MHDALTVLEIVQIIFSDVNKPQLVHLACTCKAFQELALNELWKEQRSLVPLITVMPKDLWYTPSLEKENGGWLQRRKEGPVSKINVRCLQHLLWRTKQLTNLPTQSLTRETEETDWEAFEYYAQKIRVLHVDKPPQISDTVIEALLLRQNTMRKPLLPKLRTLHLQTFYLFQQTDRFDWTKFAALILPPSIQHFVFKINYYVEHLSKIMEFFDLVSQCSNAKYTARIGCREVWLREKVESDFSDGRPVPWLAFVKKFDSIVIHTFHLTEAVDCLQDLRILQNADTLRELKIKGCKFGGPEGSDATQAGAGRPFIFPHLNFLELTSIDFQQVLEVIQMLAAPLHTLCLRPSFMAHQLTDADLMISYSQAIAQFNGLEDLTLSIYPIPLTGAEAFSTDNSNNAHQVAANSLEILFSLHQLREVRINMLADKLNDSYLSKVPSAWPRLQFLQLTSTYEKRSSGMTLEGLIPIAVLCKNLVELEITLAVYPFPLDHQAIPFGFTGNQSMRNLTCIRSLLECPSQVVECILRLFPRLESAQGCWDTSGVSTEGFTYLNQLFKERVAELNPCYTCL